MHHPTPHPPLSPAPRSQAAIQLGTDTQQLGADISAGAYKLRDQLDADATAFEGTMSANAHSAAQAIGLEAKPAGVAIKEVGVVIGRTIWWGDHVHAVYK